MKKPRGLVFPLILVALLFLAFGFGLGALATPTPEPQTRWKTGPTKEIEVEKIVEVTPQSCITVLDETKTVREVAAGYIGLIPDAAEAGWNRSDSQANAVSEKMETLRATLEAANEIIAPNELDCRALAQ